MNTTRRATTAPHPKDVLGVPFLPPGGITLVGNRIRAVVGRLHASMAPPPVRILEGLFGMLDHRVLVAITEAGVPDALTGPMEITDLANRIDADPAMLSRLVRYAATRGWVRVDRRGRVRPTSTTRFLRDGHPGGWRSWVEFSAGEEVVAAVAALSARSDRIDGFAEKNGAPFFEWMVRHPDRWATFDRAMAAGARMHAIGLEAALDWSDTRSVCDVGGGTGALTATLLELLPDVHGTVLDLPEVVERAVDHPRLTPLGGDAFVTVPEGFDTYLLVNVLHDWNDTDASRLLGRVSDAAVDRSRVVVVESNRTTVPRPDMAVAADVLMAALTEGGKERDADQFRALGAGVGLHLEESVRLPSADVAHIFRLR